LFIAYPRDHEPRHVHGFTGETEVIVDIGIDGTVRLADRPDCMRPGNAKRSDVSKILKTAAEYFGELSFAAGENAWVNKHIKSRFPAAKSMPPSHVPGNLRPEIPV